MSRRSENIVAYFLLYSAVRDDVCNCGMSLMVLDKR